MRRRTFPDLGAVAVAAAGVIAAVPRVSAWDEEAANLELSNAASFPYDFTAAGAEALAGSATRRRLRVSPTDLQGDVERTRFRRRRS